MKAFLVSTLVFMLVMVTPPPLFAAENPLAKPNNKVGIHILFPEELEEAAKLVNSSGGEWGYVIIPIQSGDKNLVKWQAFMDEARNRKVIPIIRLATEGDYFNTKVWRKPTETDVIDFANFLSSLDWPTKNRYIVVFNEVNRGDEWGGTPNPSEYAHLLSYAVTVFKSKSPDYFMIDSGMDNASVNTNIAMNQFTYFQHMHEAVPGIFNQIDGHASHSYPNPAFAQPPSKQDNMSIASFRFEKEMIENMRSVSTPLPIFITETGWSLEKVSEDTIAQYYKTAFQEVWSDESVIAVTPFILRAGGGPFTQFSFLRADNSPTHFHQTMTTLPKVKGQPTITKKVLGEHIVFKKDVPIKSFTDHKQVENAQGKRLLKNAFKWLLKID